MLTQYAGAVQPDGWLLDIELEPGQILAQKSAGPSALGSVWEVLTARGRHNRVQVGVPQVVDVLAAWPDSERLGSEIKATLGRFRYLSARLACSFVADRGCRFTFVRYGVQLSAGDAAAVAVDLFPRTVTEPRKYSRAYSVDGKLKFGFAEVSAKASSSGDIIHYEPTVTGTGLLTEAVGWQFRAGPGAYLDGIREMFLLVKSPVGAAVRASFTVEAEVRTALGTIPLRRYRRPEQLTQSYELSP